MEIKSYLNRIQFLGSAAPTPTTLSTLHKQHLLNIPFENLDIHYGIPIELDLEQIYTKIVAHNRGGFCYELNGLFAWLLEGIGFKVNMVSARVHKEKDAYGDEFDHMALLVSLEGKSYLCDVGFGDFTFEPLEFVLNQKLQDENDTFIFDTKVKGYYRVSKVMEGKLNPSYIFTTQPRQLKDFEPMCQYHQTSSQSHFTQKKVISKRIDKGRITLNNNQLKITKGAKVEIKNLEAHEFDLYLKQYFDIELLK